MSFENVLFQKQGANFNQILHEVSLIGKQDEISFLNLGPLLLFSHARGEGSKLMKIR